MKKNYLLVITIFVLLFIFISCQSYVVQKTLKDEIKSTPGRKLSDHSFDSNSSLISRVVKKPDAILEFLRQYDSNPNYTLYIPSDEEMKVIQDALNSLPPLNQKVLKEKLVGFYFVNNLLGSGFTDFILGDNDELYYFMAFNPTVFRKNMDEWLTFKDSTCFIHNQPEERVEIQINSKLPSFLGILLHESVHAVDYAINITPYVEPAVLSLMKNVKKYTLFIENTWKDYSLPETSNLYSKREKVTFYKMRQGPLIPITEARDLYENLSKTDFASLYSSLSWAEDLADLVMYYHLTEKMKNSYKIVIYNKNKKIYSYEPMKSDRVKKRFDKIQIFYQN